MKRRQFLGFVGSAAVWSLEAQAQQTRIYRIGILSPLSPGDAVAQTRIAAFMQGLQEFGWTIGSNVRVEMRWASKADDLRRMASELSALAPDVILAPGSATTNPLLQVTKTIPLVFVHVADPVGAGFVESLSHPGGNATGFTLFEYSTSTKWLDILAQIAPGVKRVAVLRDATIGAGIGQFSAIQAMAQSLKIETFPLNVRVESDIELWRRLRMAD